MKKTRLVLLLLFASLLLAACERPVRDAPAVDGTPNTAPLEDKPADDLTIPPEEGAPAEGTEAAPSDDAAGETPAEGNGDEGAATPDDGETPAEDSPETQVTPAPDEDIVYVVEAGDTLSTIALLYGIDMQDIIVANNLTNPDSLEVGQQLLIPLSGDVTPPAGDDGDAGGEIIHVVTAGDTLFRIAQAYGVEMQEIIDYNNLANPDRLEVGQEIRIPQ